MNDVAKLTTEETKQVTQVIIRLGTVVDALITNNGYLEERLSCVLNSGGPMKDDSPEQELVPLAHRIQVSVDNVNRQNDMIVSILDRLEL